MTTSAPTLPSATLARLIADLQARGREFKLTKSGALAIRPRPSGRERALIAANRSAVVALLGLAPDPQGETSGEGWAGQERATTPSWLTARSASSFGSLAADLGADLSGIGAQDFAFDFLFPKQVREYRPGRRPLQQR